ncbi:MAG: hypothetical protein HY706_16080 [Candidatus Hydrogenedentes bacterium]|nr:hypothetical protein [Candidatus Hydrogenedentota bacterium]
MLGRDTKRVAMTARERFQYLMNFEPVDRLPILEWATWWDKTIARWRNEGLPAHLVDAGEIREYFGQDCYRQLWISPRKATLPSAPAHGRGIVTSLAEYEGIKEHLYPEAIDVQRAREYANRQAAGNMVVWVTLEGFFWYPRTLLGIENHLTAFYERPETVHAMNQDLLDFLVRMLDVLCAVCRPDFMTFAEDMSYHNGPMVSKALFDEFMAPYYRQIVPKLHGYGIIPFIDTDGRTEDLVPWFAEVGIDGFLPMERQAGCDIVALRREYPRLRIIGGYDKMIMTNGEDALRREFERILPVMRQGGYIPGVDHQTPPGVSLSEYRTYLKLLTEYCDKAAS